MEPPFTDHCLVRGSRKELDLHVDSEAFHVEREDFSANGVGKHVSAVEDELGGPEPRLLQERPRSREAPVRHGPERIEVGQAGEGRRQDLIVPLPT